MFCELNTPYLLTSPTHSAKEIYDSLFKTMSICLPNHLNTTKSHIFSIFLFNNKIVLCKDVWLHVTLTNSTRCLSRAVADNLLLAGGKASRFISHTRSSISGVIKKFKWLLNTVASSSSGNFWRYPDYVLGTVSTNILGICIPYSAIMPY